VALLTPLKPYPYIQSGRKFY